MFLTLSTLPKTSQFLKNNYKHLDMTGAAPLYTYRTRSASFSSPLSGKRYLQFYFLNSRQLYCEGVFGNGINKKIVSNPNIVQVVFLDHTDSYLVYYHKQYQLHNQLQAVHNWSFPSDQGDVGMAKHFSKKYGNKG